RNAALLGLIAIVAGGVREELQRAFLLDRFERNLGPSWAGVMLLSTAFGLGHLLQGRDAAIATGAMGAFWAVVYLRRRSSLAPMVVPLVVLIVLRRIPVGLALFVLGVPAAASAPLICHCRRHADKRNHQQGRDSRSQTIHLDLPVHAPIGSGCDDSIGVPEHR